MIQTDLIKEVVSLDTRVIILEKRLTHLEEKMEEGFSGVRNALENVKLELLSNKHNVEIKVALIRGAYWTIGTLGAVAIWFHDILGKALKVIFN